MERFSSLNPRNHSTLIYQLPTFSRKKLFRDCKKYQFLLSFRPKGKILRNGYILRPRFTRNDNLSRIITNEKLILQWPNEWNQSYRCNADEDIHRHPNFNKIFKMIPPGSVNHQIGLITQWRCKTG